MRRFKRKRKLVTTPNYTSLQPPSHHMFWGEKSSVFVSQRLLAKNAQKKAPSKLLGA